MSKKKKSPVPGVPDEIRAYMSKIGMIGCKATGRKGLAAQSPERMAEIQAMGRAARKKRCRMPQ